MDKDYLGKLVYDIKYIEVMLKRLGEILAKDTDDSSRYKHIISYMRFKVRLNELKERYNMIVGIKPYWHMLLDVL